MPGLDKTGPEGKGSKTGRGLGTCGSKTSIDESKEEQNSQNLGKNFPGRIRLGRRGAGRGNRFRHRGGQDK